MARVFLATDRALGRRVVIKVLSPELAAELSAKRFAREIRLAASLQQANIVPVLSAGETDGVPHYVMPFVEGLSLREKLERDGRVSLSQAVSILRDVARALAYAHERGVVHRDIKPENILLSGDAAVVTDFGIAKAVAAAKLSASGSDESQPGSPRAETTVTQIGTAVGTPAYMAPEQISTDPTVDHRADIYSFGCLAYELLTGAPPFASPVVHVLFAAHLSQQPVYVGEKNTQAPLALAALIMRCLEKDPASRPQTMREILPVLEGTSSGATPFTRLTRRLSPRARRVSAVAILALAAAAAVFLVRASRAARTPALATIAVVPFLNAAGDSAHEYLADGMAEGLSTALGKVAGIRVASRSLGYRYKGQRVIDAKDVGRQLSVDHVLHGTVRRVGDRVRVSAQLISAADNKEVWSDNYEGSSNDAFAMQDQFTRQIVVKLGGRLGVTSTSLGTSDPEAYDLYLRGRFLLQRRGTGVRQAAEKFEQAIAKDSAFALAHGSLALALELMPYFERVNARELGPQAIAAARRALSLDSTIAEAHTALAMAHQHLYQWRLAEESYRRALAVNADEADAHIQYGRFLWYNGRVAESEPHFQRARALDPYSAVASSWLGHVWFVRGDSARGLAEMRRAVEIDSTSPPSVIFLTGALLRLGRREEARMLSERLARTIFNWRGVAVIALQEPDKLRERIRALEAEVGINPLANTLLAQAYSALGDSVGMFQAFERATAAGEIWPTYYSLSDPRFDFVRRSERFARIVRDVGLDVAIFTSPTGGRTQ
jgi:TolB-like protein/tetratricopeptide (TPR) repeat protein